MSSPIHPERSPSRSREPGRQTEKDQRRSRPRFPGRAPEGCRCRHDQGDEDPGLSRLWHERRRSTGHKTGGPGPAVGNRVTFRLRSHRRLLEPGRDNHHPAEHRLAAPTPTGGAPGCAGTGPKAGPGRRDPRQGEARDGSQSTKYPARGVPSPDPPSHRRIPELSGHLTTTRRHRGCSQGPVSSLRRANERDAALGIRHELAWRLGTTTARDLR